MAVKAAGRRNVPKLLLATPVYAVLWFIPLSSWVFRERPESEKRKPQGNNKDNNNKRQDKVAQREERERRGQRTARKKPGTTQIKNKPSAGDSRPRLEKNYPAKC